MDGGIGGTPSRAAAQENRLMLLRLIRKAGPVTKRQLSRALPMWNIHTLDGYLRVLKARGRLRSPKHGLWEATNSYTPEEARAMEDYIISKRPPPATKPVQSVRKTYRRAVNAEILQKRRNAILSVLTDQPQSRSDIMAKVPGLTHNMFAVDRVYLVKNDLVGVTGEHSNKKYIRKEGTT